MSLKTLKSLAYPGLALRIIIPSLIFWNPKLIIILMLFLDWVDGQFWYQKGIKKVDYDLIDKSLDFYGYIFLMIFSVLYLSYQPLLVGLFLFRLTGQVIFYFKKSHKVLLWFPNFFEFAFISVLFFGKSDFFILILLLSFILKLVQEIFLHKLLFEDNLARKIPEIFRGPID